MARAIWSGAISIGLVHVPVEMHSATRDTALDFDLLDKRDFAPVGYQRINKATGKAVDWKNIVKGYEYAKGEYVALSEEDFRRANVKATQTISIQGFVESSDIAPTYFETPYFLSPGKGGDKVYALFREVLSRTGRLAVGSFVMRGREHLCAVRADGNVLVLLTLRFAEQLKEASDLELPDESTKALGITAAELSMAERLVNEMSIEWRPEAWRDTYREDLLARIEERVKAGELRTPAEAEGQPTRATSNVIDLMTALKKSLDESGRADGASSSGPARPRSRRARSRRAPARRRA